MPKGWYGSPVTETWYSRKGSCRVTEMTALASMYVVPGFVIAADGRCKSDDEEFAPFDTEYAQKIFPIKNEGRALAYSLIGFAGTNDGKFKLVDELAKAADILKNRRVPDYPSYIHRFCHHVQQTVNRARRDGRISEFPKNDHMPPERRNSLFRLLIVGYYKGKPWYSEVNFARDENEHVYFTAENGEPKRDWIAVTGSDAIAEALFGGNRDSRFDRYREITGDDVISRAACAMKGYIEACGDPLSSTLDPLCKGIGGHTHIAEVTPENGFRWRIPPRLG